MCCVLQEFITYVVMATLFLIAGIVAAAQAPHSSGAVAATAVSNTTTHRSHWHLSVSISHNLRFARTSRTSIIMAAPYGIGQAIIFLPCGFHLLSFFFFFPRVFSAVGDWMSTILLHIMWP